MNQPSPPVRPTQAQSQRNGTSLVVGASRGIGLALAEMLLSNEPECVVIATHRPAGPSGGLRALADRSAGRLELLPLEFTSDESLQNFQSYLQDRPDHVERVIHAAGLLHEGEIQPEKTITQCRSDHLMRLFEVNSIGPLMVAQAVLSAQHRKNRFSFAALSAMVGSIGDNRLGGWYGYRASKSALNQFIRTLSIECRIKFPRATIIAIHPGTTDSDLSKPFQRNVAPDKLYAPDQTASRILSVIDQLDENDSGQFFNWDGHQIPW